MSMNEHIEQIVSSCEPSQQPINLVQQNIREEMDWNEDSDFDQSLTQFAIDLLGEERAYDIINQRTEQVVVVSRHSSTNFKN